MTINSLVFFKWSFGHCSCESGKAGPVSCVQLSLIDRQHSGYRMLSLRLLETTGPIGRWKTLATAHRLVCQHPFSFTHALELNHLHFTQSSPTNKSEAQKAHNHTSSDVIRSISSHFSFSHTEEGGRSFPDFVSVQPVMCTIWCICLGFQQMKSFVCMSFDFLLVESSGPVHI